MPETASLSIAIALPVPRPILGLRGRTLDEWERVGTNKRYAGSIDRQQHDRVNEMIMGKGAPSSLTVPELELDRLPVTRTPKPERVKVWVHYGDAALRIDAELVAWTPRACAVRWKTGTGEEHHAWVWASAVERNH